MTHALVKEKEGEAAAVPAHKPRGLLMPLYNAAAMMQLHEAVTELIQKSFKPNLDFGTIPGTKKDTLLKPGAEKACIAFGTSVRFEIVEQEIDHDREVQWVKSWKGKSGKPGGTKSGISFGLYRYVVRAIVYRLDGADVVGEGLGSCSTMESKYVDRPRDCENTALKMAKKRALVDAALSTFGLSDRFTQDVEDMKAAGEAVADDEDEVPERKPVVIETLEQAKKFPIPGAAKAWGGYGGKEFDAAPTKVLTAIFKWADERITKAGTEGHEPDDQLIAWKRAAELILKDRNVPGTVPAPATEEAAPAAAPVAAPAPAPTPARHVDCCDAAKRTNGVDHDDGCEHFNDLPF